MKSDKGETTTISLDKQGNVVDYSKDTEKYRYSEQRTSPVKANTLAKQHKPLQPTGLVCCSQARRALPLQNMPLDLVLPSLRTDSVLCAGRRRDGTMIYRTNKDTGKIENMIVVTRGDNDIEYTPWREYF